LSTTNPTQADLSHGTDFEGMVPDTYNCNSNKSSICNRMTHDITDNTEYSHLHGTTLYLYPTYHMVSQEWELA
jgi:hypothetical protein